MTDRLVIHGKISNNLDFSFSTDERNDRILLTYYDEAKDKTAYHCIYLSRKEAEKLRNTINVVLNFTPEESGL